MDKTGCRDVTELLALYHYGELDDAGAKMVEAHIAGCAACAAELADIRRVVGMVTPALAGQFDSARVKAGVMGRISGARPGPMRRFAPAFAAAALAAVASLVLGYWAMFAPVSPQTIARPAVSPAPVVQTVPKPQEGTGAATKPQETVKPGGEPKAEEEKPVDIEVLYNYEMLANLDILEDMDTLDEVHEL